MLGIYSPEIHSCEYSLCRMILSEKEFFLQTINNWQALVTSNPFDNKQVTIQWKINVYPDLLFQQYCRMLQSKYSNLSISYPVMWNIVVSIRGASLYSGSRKTLSSKAGSKSIITFCNFSSTLWLVHYYTGTHCLMEVTMWLGGQHSNDF